MSGESPSSAPGPAPKRKPRGPKPTNPVSTPADPRPGFTAVGRVLRPHALRGEVRVQVFSPSALNIQPGRRIYLEGTRHVIQEARPDKDAWILKISGLTDRAEVEHLRGALLETPDKDVIRDDEESYFVHELIGLTVTTDEGIVLGEITDILQAGAADVYVITGPEGETLIPAIADVVKSISLPERRVLITPLPGMLDKTK